MAGRILVADSVATNRIIIKVKLAAASYDVDVAQCADQIVAKISQNTPDLIILDASIAKPGHFDLCRRIRSMPMAATTPIIVMSDENTPEVCVASLAAGANDFLPKPIDRALLLARIRNLLRAGVLGKELERRQGTALELGLSEATAPFARQGGVALISGNPEDAVKWRQTLEKQSSHSIQVLPHEKALESIAHQPIAPDVIVISTDLAEKQDGLTLLAELRSRRSTRFAAIILVVASQDERTAVAGLDMGADDLVATDCDHRELVLRINAQLAQKLRADRLRETVEDGLKLAMVDPLTGLFNRRYAIPHLASTAKRAAFTGKPFAVMVLDLDHFKRINDQFGHSAGDTVLIEVSRRIKENLRSVDLVARIGGEEFLVVLPESNLTEARAAAERLRLVTAESPIELPESLGAIDVTLSIGVSLGGTVPAKNTPVQTVFDAADRALLGAKSEGRNQVTFGKSAA